MDGPTRLLYCHHGVIGRVWARLMRWISLASVLRDIERAMAAARSCGQCSFAPSVINHGLLNRLLTSR
jgi:hypothetical protein